jgi:hypothetical protein
LKSTLLFFLFCFYGLFAQTKAVVAGTVKSSESENLFGATIYFQVNNIDHYVRTDSVGFFSKKIPLGRVNVVIKHQDYLEKNFYFNLSKDTLLSISLEKERSVLNEVIITNTKKAGITSLSGGKLSFNLKELVNLPTVLGTTDIIKILQLTPGVQNSGDANGYLYVRGGDPGHNAILYSGTPVYGMSHLLGIFPFYNTDHIKEVEFDKSSSNSKFGGRLSSTTVLSPNKNVPSDFQIQGNIGILASQVTVAVPVSNKTGFYISGRRTYIDEVVAPLVKSGSDNQDVKGMNYGFSDGNFTFISQLSEKNLFSVDAFVSADELKVKDGNLALQTNLKWSNFIVSPTLVTTFSSKVSMSNAAYFSQYSNDLNMEQATIRFGVSSYVKDFGFNNSFRYLIKNTPIESGFQYVLHNLQPQKISVKNLTDSSNAFRTAKEFAEAAVFTTLSQRLRIILMLNWISNQLLFLRSKHKFIPSFSTSYLIELYR